MRRVRNEIQTLQTHHTPHIVKQMKNSEPACPKAPETVIDKKRRGGGP